jgi:hypothetical protein
MNYIARFWTINNKFKFLPYSISKIYIGTFFGAPFLNQNLIITIITVANELYRTNHDLNSSSLVTITLSVLGAFDLSP